MPHTSCARVATEEEVNRLRQVLDRYGLNSYSTFEISHGFTDDVGGWTETVRGAYSIHPEDTREFLAAEADAVWFYDNSGRIDDGMMVGTEGLLALKGCTAIAQMVTVIYN